MPDQQLPAHGDGQGDVRGDIDQSAPKAEVVPVQRSTVDRRLAPWSARTDTAVRWIGWHLAEIGVVGGTAVAGLVVHPLWWAVTVPAGAGWLVHERAVRRRAHAKAARLTIPAAPADAGPATASKVDQARQDTAVQTGVSGSDNGFDDEFEDGEVQRDLA